METGRKDGRFKLEQAAQTTDDEDHESCGHAVGSDLNIQHLKSENTGKIQAIKVVAVSGPSFITGQ